MTRLDDEVQRLAKRITVARLGLAQGGPVELLPVLLAPIADSIAAVTKQLKATEQPTYAPVDEPIGPATTAVLADMVSPVPAADRFDSPTGRSYPMPRRTSPPHPKAVVCLHCDRRLVAGGASDALHWVTSMTNDPHCDGNPEGGHLPC